MKTAGMVYLVGAGPGDPGLLTLRGAELLRQADVVIYDGLVNPSLLRGTRADAEIIAGGKHDRTRCVSQETLNALLVDQARRGRCVVRLKGGDPYLFGRGGEEAEALAAAGLPFEVVPGVSSLHAVPAYAGIPLTGPAAGASLTVVTGHEPPDATGHGPDWAALAQAPGTLVVLMALRNVRAIAATLIAHGRSPATPAAVISHGTTGRQRTVIAPLATLADRVERASLPAPAIIVIGEVVAARGALDWFESRPLFGRRVVVTQRSDLARPTVARLREEGAEVLEIPATRWRWPADLAALDHALDRPDDRDWILFSHPFAVDHFLQRVVQKRGDLRALGRARLGAYGPATGETLRAWHLRPDAVSADHKTPLILDAITRGGDVRGKRFLVVRGEVATERVPEALVERGATVEVVAAFGVEAETDAPGDDAGRLRAEGADWIVFASGLAIEHLQERFGLRRLVAQFPRTKLALTTETIWPVLTELGLSPAVVSTPNDVAGLVGAIVTAERPVGDGPAG
jgi:uroporphyrinogen III methyltransferase/synthase